SASGTCLGYQGNFASGVALQVSDCNASPALDGLGWFARGLIAGGGPTAGSIMGPGGKCLDDSNDGLDNGNKIQLWDCNGTDAQNWTLTEWGEILGPGGKCLDAAGGDMSNGTVVQLWDCNGTAAQQWTWGEDGPIWPLLGAGNKCLDARGGE